MKTFRNNNRRTRFRNNDRGYKRNGDMQKYNPEFAVNSHFQRKAPGRNNHNAPKLIEKYNDLAREALSNGDKILSENYFQHAEHFIRVLEEKGAQSNKAQISKEIVKVKEKTSQDQNNTNGIDSESLEQTTSTES
jgi:hypothetical protein